MHVVLYNIFKIPRPRKVGLLNFLNVTILIILDVIRFRAYGKHLMLDYDAIVGMILVIAGVFYLIKKIRLIPVVVGIYLLTSLISMMAAGVISTLLLIRINTLFTEVWHSLFGNLVGLILLIILCMITRKNNVQLDITRISAGGSFLILIGALSYGFYISNFLLLGDARSETPIGNLINLIALIAGFVSVFSVIMLISRNISLKIKGIRERYLEELLEQKNQYTQMKEKQDEEIRNFRHNINEHLIAINELAKNNQISSVSQYINGLMGNLMEIEMISEKTTGSDIISANLYHLKHKYQQLDIDFKWVGLIPQGIKISDNDLIALFTNILKNAFEAVSKIDGRKYINANIKEDNQFLYINVKNNHNGFFERYNESFITTKPDKKNHGFGIKTIEKIVAKYGGRIEFKTTEKEFEVEIIFKSEIYEINRELSHEGKLKD